MYNKFIINFNYILIYFYNLIYNGRLDKVVFARNWLIIKLNGIIVKRINKTIRI
jgi:hypothetical protein